MCVCARTRLRVCVFFYMDNVFFYIEILQRYEGPLRSRQLYSFFYSAWTQILSDDWQVPESRGGAKGQQP